LNNRPQVVLLSRLSIRGETLFKALQNVCTVKWIARKPEFGTDPVRLALHLVREFFRLWATCRSVPETKLPIVLVHFVGLDAIPAFAVRRVTACKVMLYAVGPEVLGERKLAQTSLLRWAVNKADVVLCGSAKVEEVVRGLGGTVTKVLPAPFVPLKLGTDGKKEFDVVTVGSLTDAAKQSLLVEASEYLDPSVKIAIVGEGPQRQYLKTLSRQHGRNQVSFLTDLTPNGVYHTLRSSALYVQCSHDEGMPPSVLAAACYGLPIIALNGDDDPELTEVYGLRSIVPEDPYAVSLANVIEGAMANYSALLPDVSNNREALESYSRSWPSLAATAIFS
jgi:glycosyltransferase involved in cell wall biosynthesis